MIPKRISTVAVDGELFYGHPSAPCVTIRCPMVRVEATTYPVQVASTRFAGLSACAELF